MLTAILSVIKLCFCGSDICDSCLIIIIIIIIIIITIIIIIIIIMIIITIIIIIIIIIITTTIVILVINITINIILRDKGWETEISFSPKRRVFSNF